ncbi:MAG: hypothetical protein JHD16_04790, partial [Solirubrobacteraceae bacterium]|nr:hypothetical protein [Solirubrobacteraceae bacterium]
MFCALLLLPGVAAAKPKLAIWGPAERDGVSQFPIYQDLGVDILELQVNWRNTAATRPA